MTGTVKLTGKVAGSSPERWADIIVNSDGELVTDNTGGSGDPPTTGAKSNVSGATSSTPILAANTARKGASIFNDSVATLYLDTSGGTASATSFSVMLLPGDFYELPLSRTGVYTGLITGIWSSATGAARVTEHT